MHSNAHLYIKTYNIIHTNMQLQVILTKEKQPASTVVKLHVKKVGPCKLPKINNNAYKVELHSHLQISNCVNV